MKAILPSKHNTTLASETFSEGVWHKSKIRGD
jgi:hypothetical protein